MAIRLGVILLFADDFAAMRRFYGETLGLPERRDIDPGPPYEAGETWTFFDTPGGGIELFDRGKHGDWLELSSPRGNAIVLAFRVDQLDETVASLRAAGVGFDGDVSTQEWGSSAYLRDPEGNLVQLYTPSTGSSLT
ncbi:MAG TPA: VOC family protein [Gaiellaceae bacterium]|jgi:catechol 2,3-dioxygenase-like lactoylglutathione lyase family enzyme